MKNGKLKLNEIKVKSFTTSLPNPEKIAGGGAVRTKGVRTTCPHTGAPTLDAAGCNSVADFYCNEQTIYTCQDACDIPDPVNSINTCNGTCPYIPEGP